MNIGVCGVDPGGATGMAWGIFDPKHHDGMAGALRDRMHSGSCTITGDERTQIREMASIWGSFFNACVRDACLPPDKIWLAVENFVLKPGETSGGSDSTAPLPLIWGLEGYRMGRADQYASDNVGHTIHIPTMALQYASEAKSFATGKRMKEWGVWVVGREHERSAWSQIVYFLKRYMTQVR